MADAARDSQEVAASTQVSPARLNSEKGNALETTADPEDQKQFPDETPDYDAQRGIQEIEATTLAWNKWSLAALLIKYVRYPHKP